MSASQPTKCLTPGAIYEVGGDDHGCVHISVRTPCGGDWAKLYVGGNFAITPRGSGDQERLLAYEQMYAEREVISKEIHDALEPVIAKLYRTIWPLALAGRKIDGEVMPQTYDEYLAASPDAAA